MIGDAYAFVTGGAALDATSNIFSRKALDGGMRKREWLLTGFFTGVSSLFLFAIWWILGAETNIKSGFWFAVFATGLLNIGIQYFSTKSRSLEDVSLVTPIAASTPAIVIILSLLILGEKPSLIGWIGIYLLIIGVYILNIQEFLNKKKKNEGRVTWKDWFAPFLMLSKSVGIRYAFGAACLGALALNYDGLIARTADIKFALAVKWLIVALPCLFMSFMRKEIKKETSDRCAPRRFAFRHIIVISLIGVLLSVAGILNAMAFQETIVPYVGTLKRLQIPMTIILAYFFLGEKLNFKNRLGGGIIMAVGALLVGIS
ncbi:MAG: EamA family transporter [Patescibacteria group bacterium]|mgnify:CR=1 FL=1